MQIRHPSPCARTAPETVSHAHLRQNAHNVYLALFYTTANAQQHAHQQNTSTDSTLHAPTANNTVSIVSLIYSAKIVSTATIFTNNMLMVH